METGQTALTAEEVRAEALWASAVWDEQTEQWLRPQNDPYKLENFQQAYDNLVSGRSNLAASRAASVGVETLSTEIAKEFSGAAKRQLKLKATHYAVRILPKTEEEQRTYELDEELRIAYTPFDHVALSEEMTARLNATTQSQPGGAIGESKLFRDAAEDRRYSVTYADLMTTEGPADPVTLTLPVLYAVWPVGKAFPAAMDYEIMYEGFLPRTETPVKAAGGVSGVGVSGTISSETSGVPFDRGDANLAAGFAAVRELELSADALQTLECEAIELALQDDLAVEASGVAAETGDTDKYQPNFVPKGGGWAPRGPYNPVTGEFDPGDTDWRWPPSAELYPTGKVVQFDNFIVKDIGIENLRVDFWLGTQSWGPYYTDSEGVFSSNGQSIPRQANLVFTFDHTYWRITYRGSTTPIIETFWKPYSRLTGNYLGFKTEKTATAHYVIHRAANYYFHNEPTHHIPVNRNKIRIEAWATGNPEYPTLQGLFCYDHIEIYDRYGTSQSDPTGLTGIILHELGHFSHYGMRGSDGFAETHELLVESWAPYVGKTIGEAYYRSLGWEGTDPIRDFDITSQAKQGWSYTWKLATNRLAPYSPLFVDLVDDYNQVFDYDPVLDNLFPNDKISGVPYDVINRLGREAANWDDFKRIFNEYISTTYPGSRLMQVQLSEFYSAWDYWFDHN